MHLFSVVVRHVTCKVLSQGTSLVVQWLRLCTSTAGGMSLIPGQGTKIPYAAGNGQKRNKNKFKKPLLFLKQDFPSGSVPFQCRGWGLDPWSGY